MPRRSLVDGWHTCAFKQAISDSLVEVLVTE